MRRLVVVAATLGACTTAPADYDNIFSRGAPDVTCALNVDDKNNVGVDAIAAALDRAQSDGLVLHLYAHKPAQTVELSTLETVIAGAADRGLPFVTYRDLVDGMAGDSGGLAFAFDDHDIDGWHALRPLFMRYHARITFFISAYDTFDDQAKHELRDLVADGHDIEYHTTHHWDAKDYANSHGVDAYFADEIAPDLAMMRADGFDMPVFAYPFGAHTSGTDDMLLRQFRMLRAIKTTCPR